MDVSIRKDPVVVAVDGSDHACSATEWAAELALALAAPLHLVEVAGPARQPSMATWLGMLRVAAWRAGTEPERIEPGDGRPADLPAGRVDGARLLVLGVDPIAERAAVATLAGRVSCPVAVVRGPGPRRCPPRQGPVLAAGGAAAPAVAAELAAVLGAPLGTLDLADTGPETALPTLLGRARPARLLVFDPHPWPAGAGHRLVELAPCPVVVLGQPGRAAGTAARRSVGAAAAV